MVDEMEKLRKQNEERKAAQAKARAQKVKIHVRVSRPKEDPLAAALRKDRVRKFAERIRGKKEWSREQARGARQQREEEALEEWIRKQLEAERRRREEQTHEAADLLKLLKIESNKAVIRCPWDESREEAGQRQGGSSRNATSPPSPTSTTHPQAGRPPKANGRASCLFCDICRERWVFQCAVCS